MASTYSDLKFELIGTGEQSGTWGNTTNTNLGTAIQEAITGSADVTFASGTVTLTLTDTNATQTARNLRLNLTGTSGGAQNLIVPAIEKFYLVNNGVADAITVKNSTGTGIAVPAGKAMLVFNDGTNVVDAVTHMSSLTLTNALAVAQGGTGATTASDARTNLGLGTIATQAANAVSITGGTITGITDLAVADGGTGASTAADARTNLGLGTIATQNTNAVTITGGSITGIIDLTVADGGTGVSTITGLIKGNGASAFSAATPGTDYAKPDTLSTWTASQRGEITVLTDGASITPDFNNSNNYTVTLGGNRTMQNPSNIVAGQSGSIFIVQDGTGGRTLSFASYWDFIDSTAPTLSTTAVAVDRIDYIVRSSTSIQAVLTKAYG